MIVIQATVHVSEYVKKNGFDFPKAVLDQCNFNEWKKKTKLGLFNIYASMSLEQWLFDNNMKMKINWNFSRNDVLYYGEKIISLG